VCILYAGGTIGMVETDEGHVPHPSLLQDYLDAMLELRRAEVPAWDLVTLSPLQDSADMVPADWVRVAEAIHERYERYDGFVVLHGTDTMAYTASALSFLLLGLAKPVVLTGAQLSLEDLRSDGREHVITSIVMAGTLPVPEVTIYFSSLLLRGNRAQKIHSDDFVAFDSGNLPPLAKAGVHIRLDEALVRPPGAGLLRSVALTSQPRVAALRVFPGMEAPLLEHALATPLDGLVLETYGAGNFPSRSDALLSAIRDAADAGVVIVNCSQCHGGAVRQARYATGMSLDRAGVTSGGDMTPEAALTKLYWLLAQGSDPGKVRAELLRNVAGELTPAVGG